MNLKPAPFACDSPANLLFSGGVPARTVHELRAPEATSGHLALAAWLLARKAGPVLFVVRAVYPPGLGWLGLDPARCMFAQARDDAEALGTLEVALRGGMAGVVECAQVSRLAARRLALAAKDGGGIGFLLRVAPAWTASDSNAFATRWLVTPAPGGRLRAELLYAKGGRPAIFFMTVEGENGAADTLTLVSETAGGLVRRAG